ncbi:peptidase [Paenibacillus baekrokdamisoli]|uniref:Peptidase n=1 Tax=Paenibacillus baekrokdamisoli TaxID=1712516 RepID=A0A3G9IQM9_9BACL|nr:PBP1A family penicillin-binding protein [Paenibacillus baekrokdamisoli]MBB3070060.1 penicillin-binding protein 2A [Paenibacillus baekrokdamisoli]BBH20592.1 peptidase [Paenibacillus baekrokdamisoli]
MEPIIKEKPKKRFSWKKAIIAALLAGGLFAAAGWAVFGVMVARQDITLLGKPLPAATIIYDQNEKEASRISLNTFEAVSYDRLPKHLVDAVVAVEDKRFFEHDGMDIWGIGRALFTNLTNGKTVQGASTITQQLAKNVFLSQERTWTRKWNEVLLAKKIEGNYDKQQIMEKYLNQIYFGEGAWGIKPAAETYFGKRVNQLTLSESAMLAGIIRAPSALSPFKHPEQAKDRRNVVLQLMKEQGKISANVYDSSILEPIKLRSFKPIRGKAIKYPYYVDQIIREASNLYGLTENEVLHGGLRIYTTLDTKMQQAAERVYAQELLFPESKADQLIQSGAVLVDPRDGGIKALIGGRGNQPFRGFNRAVQLKRQPGSTMKPISVYTPAFEQGYSPDDRLLDEPVDFGGYQPKNAGGAYHGEVSIYDAIVHSYNVPAVRLLDEIGIDAGMDAANRFGIELTDADRTLGLALGGLQEGVSPLDMAEAFGVFANDGTRMPAHSIIRIESADGEILAEAAENTGEKTTESSVAHTMTAMLEGVVREGTGEAAAIEDRPVAGKTGTTEMPGTGGEGAKDNWFVGYTPQLVGAVWLGYDHTDENHYLTTTSKAAAAVFQELMSEALKGEPVIAFPKAPGISEKKQNKPEEDGKNEEKKSKPDKGREKFNEDHGKSNKDHNKSNKDHSKKDEDRSEGRKHGKPKDKDKGKRE